MIATANERSRCRPSVVRNAVGRLSAAALAVGLVAATAAAQPAATRLELVAGTVESADIEELSEARCRWRGPDGRRLDVPTAAVVSWGRCPPWPQGPLVLLAGGGVIAGTLDSVDASTAVVASTSLGRLALPAAAVAGFRCSVATGPAAAPPPDAADVRVDLANGDRVEGRNLVVGQGRVRIAIGGPDGDGRTGDVAASPRDATIPLAVVRGIDVFRTAAPPHGASPAPPRILVALDDGSRFPVASSSVPADDPAAPARVVLLAAGRPIACDCDRDAIVAVAVDGGGGRFLAALEPAAFTHAAEFGPPWPLARDRTLAGGWLSARGITGFSGLGIHGPARLAYRLDPPARRFESLVAIDDSAGQGGAAIVRVLARANAEPWREVFLSGVLRGGEEPLAIRAEFPAATAIELVVEPAPRDAGGLPGGVLDRTIWLDPRVVGEP